MNQRGPRNYNQVFVQEGMKCQILSKGVLEHKYVV